MPSATIVAAWQDASRAHVAVRVAEPGGDVEYLASVAPEELAGKTTVQKKALLGAAVRAVRHASLAAGTSDLGLTGTISV